MSRPDLAFSLYAGGIALGLIFGLASVEQFYRDRKRVGAALASLCGIAFLGALWCVFLW